jgi:hypothetical protein
MLLMKILIAINILYLIIFAQRQLVSIIVSVYLR